MNWKNSFGAFVCLLTLTSCNSQSVHDLSVPVEVIDFASLEQVDISSFPDRDNVDYVLLKSDGKELFGRIDKAKIVGDKIYIADTRLRSLVVYDHTGNTLAQVGVRGQGPKEYVNLSDFDVTPQEDIYVLDGRLNKILHYNSDFECTAEHLLPFAADVLAALGNDSLLFGLSSWNMRDGAGYKIALTDKSGKISRTCLEYDEFTDPAYWISDYRFAEAAGGQLAYNQTISNYVYLFSPEGELKKAFYLDFGKENVPDADKMEIESKLTNYDNYTLIRKILAVTDKYLIGFIWKHRQTKLFVIDYVAKKCYLGETIADTDRRCGCGYSDGKLISYIDSEDESLPDSVNQFVENEGIALKIQRIR